MPVVSWQLSVASTKVVSGQWSEEIRRGMTQAEKEQLDEEYRARRAVVEIKEKPVRAEAMVIEIPFAREQTELDVRRCTRVRRDGRRCGAPAFEDREYCYRHYIWYGIAPKLDALPYPEDGLSLQEIMGRVVAWTLTKRVTGTEAQAIADLCRTMERNLGRCQRELEGR